ncbi:MFS transporter [Paenibacillus methanolicus]|uniref:DHA1 family inner membrane transport protein n=1 Tax=Paenibacillus methanolicus TaxID=582686 RepID=A0A5S5BX58_9BACL|nr:MFS transporter [Paenibacillus methanolicus]TYP70762.1 DHA1 family inner membrane transport protein [Paenibacillus methanolicus]
MSHSEVILERPAAKERLPISIYSLTVGAFAIGMTEFVIMGILPDVATALDVSISRAGQLITGYALGVAFGAPILAMLTHRLPQKALLLLLMAIFVLGNLIAVAAPNYAVVMTARLVTALAHGTFFGVGSVIAASLVRPEKRAGAVSIMMAGLAIANIIGVPLGTFIGQHLGWRASFGAVAIMGVISLIGIIIFIPRVENKSEVSLAQQVRALLQPKLLLVLLIGALGCSSLFAVFTYITPILTDITGISEKAVSWVLVLFGVGVTVGNIVGGKLADWKLLPSLIVNFAVLAGVLALFAVTDKVPAAAIVTVFVWGVAAFGILPGLQLRIMNLAKEAPELAATSTHSALNLGNASGAFIGGAVITHWGLEKLPLVGAGLTAAGLVLLVASYAYERRKAK